MEKSEETVTRGDAAKPARFEPSWSSDREGIDLSPTTWESLVTWDVSTHAQREQDRLRSAAYPQPRETPNGY